MASHDSNGVVDIAGARNPSLAPKVITSLTVIPEARVLAITARGPLDVSDVVVHMHYSQLKHIAGQLIAQEGEAEIAAANSSRVVKPS